VISIRIGDLRSLGSWCIKGTDESTLVMDSSVPLMNYDPTDLGSLILIQITPKECTHGNIKEDSFQVTYSPWARPLFGTKPRDKT